MNKKYPSRVKYEKQNPAITCRIPVELKEKIDQMKKISGKSISQIICEFLTDGYADFSQTFSEGKKVGFEEGIETGRKRWRTWYYCSICKELIVIRPNSEDHKAIIQYMSEKGWRHTLCQDKTKQI